MKPHRWVIDIRVPAKVIRNEDHEFLINMAVDDLSSVQSRIWCYDCELPLEDVFGEECEGLKDETMTDSEWEDIP